MNSSTRLYNDADPSALSIEAARERIRQRMPLHTRTETLRCAEALGRIVASDIQSPISVPPFRASAMDGYAVRSADCTQTLTIVGQSLAGHPGADTVQVGTCQRITTGARIPDDADAVVQQENAIRQNNTLQITHLPEAGLNVRSPGSDSSQGSMLIEAGSTMGAAQIALLSAHGIDEVLVLTPLVIALFSTGDELQSAGQVLEPGQIYDANRPLLKSLLSSPAICVVDLGICKDTERDVQKMFLAAADADLVVSSGGVSVGDADFVRPVLEKQGQLDIWKIAMKPGRPLTFGFSQELQVFFGLPGNPVSAAITALQFVKPAIGHMLGMPVHQLPPLQLPLEGMLRKNPGRVEYQRAVMSTNDGGVWQVSTTGLQDSHVLSSLHKANCLIELDVDSSGASPGEIVTVIPFSHFSDNVL